jgi:hypothetical protein
VETEFGWLFLMQRFTLLHDGSAQGWQAAYLAFHIAARLGASLLALLIDSTTDEKDLMQRAKQVEVGGRAAGVAIKARAITDFSADIMAEDVAQSDGLFVPRRLTPDERTVLRFLEVLSSPLWIVSKESQMRKMAVLVNDLTVNGALINYTTSLSRRTQQSLNGFIRANELASAQNTDASIVWTPLPDFSPTELKTAFNRLDVNLLFIPVSSIDLVKELPINCVVYPAA